MSSSPKKSCRHDTWKQTYTKEFSDCFSVWFIIQVNRIHTQMAATKSNNSFLLLGAQCLVVSFLTFRLLVPTYTHIHFLVHKTHSNALTYHSALHNLTNFLSVCVERAHALSPRGGQICNTRGCLFVCACFCLHAYSMASVSVGAHAWHVPELLCCCVVSTVVFFPQLISLSANIKRPCWLTNLLTWCRMWTGHPEQQREGLFPEG